MQQQPVGEAFQADARAGVELFGQAHFEAGGEEDGILHAQIACQLGLKRAVQILRAADETDRGHSEAMVVHCGLGGGDQAGVIRKAEVIVCAEVQDLLPAHGDLSTLFALDHTFVFVQFLIFQ